MYSILHRIMDLTDFSDGQKYTNLILGIIKRFLGFEIIYQEFVNDKTDIILSDVFF